MLVHSSCLLYTSFFLSLSFLLCKFFFLQDFSTLSCVFCSLLSLIVTKCTALSTFLPTGRPTYIQYVIILEWYFVVQQNWMCISSSYFLKRQHKRQSHFSHEKRPLGVLKQNAPRRVNSALPGSVSDPSYSMAGRGEVTAQETKWLQSVLYQ